MELLPSATEAKVLRSKLVPVQLLPTFCLCTAILDVVWRLSLWNRSYWNVGSCFYFLQSFLSILCPSSFIDFCIIISPPSQPETMRFSSHTKPCYVCSLRSLSTYSVTGKERTWDQQLNITICQSVYEQAYFHSGQISQHYKRHTPNSLSSVYDPNVQHLQIHVQLTCWLFTLLSPAIFQQPRYSKYCSFTRNQVDYSENKPNFLPSIWINQV